MFQIRTSETRLVPDGYGENSIWINEEGTELDEEEEIKEYCLDYILEEGFETREKAEKVFDKKTEDEVEELLKKAGFSLVEIRKEYVYKNCFLTAKACQEHIKSNNYHYNEPTDYLDYAWRNPEMELVSEFLCGLIGKKMYT